MADYRWEDAVDRWLDERASKADIRGDQCKLKWLASHLNGKSLTQIDRVLVRKIVEQKQNNATRNRYVALIRAMLRAAQREWRWVDGVPALMTYPEPKRRVRYLTAEQVERLIDKLPPHQKDLFLFGLATGLRQGNVKGLEWEWVDLERRVAYIPGPATKNDEPLGIPLNDVAMAILQRRKGEHDRWVFTYRGNRISKVNTLSWRKGLKAAGLIGFRWHDATRHTWASWLAQAGVNSLELQELGGWKSASMVRRYAALAPSHLAKHAAVIDTVVLNKVQ